MNLKTLTRMLIPTAGWAMACGSAMASPAFVNHGTLAGFTGANQKAKVTETRLQDHDGNGTSLQCLMLRDETDTPNGGCHAEAHLARFPTGELLGSQPGFDATTSYWVMFDAGCDAASVGFFQYKNRAGPQPWFYLLALWRESGSQGESITIQTKSDGQSHYALARLSKENGTALAAGSWHRIQVKGRFTKNKDGWVEVSINGKPVDWYLDGKFTRPLGRRIAGPNLPDLSGAEWQLQLGGYGFFKDRTTRRATVFVDDIRVSSP